MGNALQGLKRWVFKFFYFYRGEPQQLAGLVFFWNFWFFSHSNFVAAIVSTDIAALLPHHCHPFHCNCCCNTQHYIVLQGWLLLWTVACTFFCSCHHLLCISVLQCLLASAWIVPQALLSIDIAVTLPSLRAGPFLLLSVVGCTSNVGGKHYRNRAKRVPPYSKRRDREAGCWLQRLSSPSELRLIVGSWHCQQERQTGLNHPV